MSGSVRVMVGDCRAVLDELPSDSFDCVITSPPYWGLRDYGVEGQIGLEPTLGEHLDVLTDVFREVRRVLKPSGTCWLNYGDCYATSPNGRSALDTKAAGNDDRTFRDKPFSTIGPIRSGAPLRAGRSQNKGNTACDGVRRNWAGEGYLKPKDLAMAPNRLAIQLQDDGWWVRSEIIWHKPNPMPESAKDRPTSAHEKLWLLTKSERYAYDAAAIAEQTNYPPGCGWEDAKRGDFLGKGSPPGQVNREAFRAIRETRNARNVWTINPSPFPGAHFATFPPELAERCIKAGCPVGGTVLDPFGGAGTVGMVADRLGRRATLVELNPAYADIARNRIADDAGMFARIT